MQTNTEPTNPANVLAGLLTRDALATQLGKSERTVIRWEHAGLPVLRIGMTRLYDPARVRTWLELHERKHEAPRRGRPAKARAPSPAHSALAAV